MAWAAWLTTIIKAYGSQFCTKLEKMSACSGGSVLDGYFTIYYTIYNVYNNYHKALMAVYMDEARNG